jgi:hypothetical protein
MEAESLISAASRSLAWEVLLSLGSPEKRVQVPGGCYSTFEEARI